MTITDNVYEYVLLLKIKIVTLENRYEKETEELYVFCFLFHLSLVFLSFFSFFLKNIMFCQG